MSMIAVASASPMNWMAVKKHAIDPSCVSHRPTCSAGERDRITRPSRGAKITRTMARFSAIRAQMICAGW